MSGTLVEILVLTVFPAAMVLAALSDLFTMSVSNRLTVGLAAAFFLVAPLAGMDLESLGIHLTAGLAMLALGIAMFAAGWVGGADAKLIAASALWLGWPSLPHYLIVGAIAGGVLAVALLTFRRMPLPAWAGAGWVSRLHRADMGAPYCIALAIAGLSAYPKSGFFALAAM